jgi:uncharacterized protein (DUF4415 family)
MQTPPENNPEMFDPRKMQSIVDRLKAEGKMPSMEKLNSVLQEFRKECQAKVRQARAEARAEKRRQGALEERVTEAGSSCVDAMTDAELVMPVKKGSIRLRIDSDVLDYFRGTGPGYLTRMNAVLRAYAKAHQQKTLKENSPKGFFLCRRRRKTIRKCSTRRKCSRSWSG